MFKVSAIKLQLKSIRLQLRFLAPLLLTLVAAAYLAVPLMDQVTLRWFSRDLNMRGVLLANALSDSIGAALAEGRSARLGPLLQRTARDERLFAIGLCSPQGRLVQQTERYPESLSCARAAEVAREAEPRFELAGGPVHVGLHPVYASPSTAPAAAAEQAIELPAEQASVRAADREAAEGRARQAARAASAAAGATAAEGAEPAVLGQLVLLHDLSFIERRSQDTRRYLIGLIAALGLIIALITVVVAQVSWNGWVRGVRAIMRGEGLLSPLVPAPELAPFAADLRSRLRDLEDEYRRSQGPETEWNAARLRSLLRSHLAGDQVIAVSNREPYIHQRVKDDDAKDDSTGDAKVKDGVADTRTAGAAGSRSHVVVQRPASGLVTALEPVMRACSGTWIAHGSGSADRETVDASDRVSVPPGERAESSYWLRRVWLTPEEEQGYYYGFANEGLWPLCHVAHVRPTFRQGDWAAYREINRRFADAVVAEARDEDPVVLVQDYHFALVPALIRERLPQATVITFWHIPWPNPESFGICPWRSEILQGLLGSTILGFHTRFHCKNFIETVDRYLEARIEHEHSSITYRGEETLIESYPISIAWPEHPDEWPPVAECRARVFARLGLAPETCLALGVDRYDYTKGILERLNAVERLLEKYPQWLERFVFAQVAAPTRSDLDEYRNFQERVERLAERINARFGRPGYKPVHLLAQHHDHAALTELYRAANLCVVTSLHDGMNLVSKEFVAARDDLAGVLVLSRFAGAARELHEALIVNPYHVEETADALHRAATMPAAEQRERMASLRTVVREFNVYRWAGRMLSDAGRWRLRERIAARVQRHRVLARETSAST
ncbi:MAG: trehalose-6-phosphate synthase [Rubrivivax sp.]